MAFDYDEMVQKALLKGVVQQALQQVAKDGLDDPHHFYITFQTNRPDVMIPGYLRERHPEEITIVLQHQFWDLVVTDRGFKVSLSFNDNPEIIEVPFGALLNFVDPSQKFILKFLPSPAPEMDESTRPTDDQSPKDNVVTLDTFRKK